jgi:hypothetical protein
MDEIAAVGAVSGGRQLTANEMAEVAKLAARDREVRIHEAQHAAAAGAMAGGVEYDYEAESLATAELLGLVCCCVNN